MPLKVANTHFLARAIVSAPKHINRIVVILGTVQEAAIRHRCQFNKRKILQIQDHRILGASTVIVTAQNNDFIAADQRARLSFYRQGELDTHHAPGIIRDIILLDGVDSAGAFVAPAPVDLALLEDDSWHSTPFLVQLCDRLPLIEADAGAFAAIEHAVY